MYVVVSNLIGHCVEHADYPSTVPHVNASAADLLSLRPKECVARHGKSASDGHDTVQKTTRQVRHFV